MPVVTLLEIPRAAGTPVEFYWNFLLVHHSGGPLVFYWSFEQPARPPKERVENAGCSSYTSTPLEFESNRGDPRGQLASIFGWVFRKREFWEPTQTGRFLYSKHISGLSRLKKYVVSKTKSDPPHYSPSIFGRGFRKREFLEPTQTRNVFTI